MKVFGLQGEIMRSVRLADKTFDDSGAFFCLRRLERANVPVTRCRRPSGNCDPWSSGGNRSTTCCDPIRR